MKKNKPENENIKENDRAKKPDKEKTAEKRENRGMNILDSLEGSVADLEKAAEEGEEEAEKPFDPAAPTMKNRRLFFVVGLVIIALALVGLYTTVTSAVGTISDIANKTALKSEFADFVYPFVVTDSPAFESIADAPPSVIVNTAIWKIIMSGNTEKYENDGTNMTVSQIDVESSAASLYGYSVTVEHQTVGVGDSTFTYNEESKSYTVPMDPNYNTYWPRVGEVSNVGETYTVTVEYMPPQMYAMEGMNIGSDPDKTMVFTIVRTASSMTIQSVAYYQAAVTEGQ